MRPNKIAVVGPGVVGMPVAAALASARGNDGSLPPRVVVVQRRSAESAWKVEAINAGRSPIGGIEPGLDAMVARAVADGHLRASWDTHELEDAEAIFVCVQVDRTGLVPDYRSLLDALEGVATALRGRPRSCRPVVVIESTLAPSTMVSVVRPVLANHGLRDGVDLLLAHSPSRVRHGRLLEDLANGDRLVAGLQAEAPVAAAAVYRRVVTGGRILATNCLTAEVVRTLENGWRDVRLAFASEIARYCDRLDVDYATLRDQVNDALEWPSRGDRREGALPEVAGGVGGRCLPQDGILLWWRALESGHPSRNSLVLAARGVNDAWPAATVRQARLDLGAINGWRVTVLGAAFHRDTADARNSPALVLANLLRDSGADVVVHDPFVAPQDPSLGHFDLTSAFTSDLDAALDRRRVVVLATAHTTYRGLLGRLSDDSSGVEGVVDACHLFGPHDFDGTAVRYSAIGRGRRAPDRRLVRSVASMYRAVARGIANEGDALVRFLNARYAPDTCDRVEYEDVRRLAATSPAGCDLDEPGDVTPAESHEGFVSGLAQLAHDAATARAADPRRGPAEPVPPGIWFGNEDAIVAGDTPWPLTPQP